MKCLSVQQPWAWLLVNGHKDVENRTWPTKVRGWVLLHAGQTVDLRALASVAQQMPQIQLPNAFDLERGAIVGAVRIDDCVESSASPWFGGPYGFVIGKACAFKTPLPQRGMLGFFRADRNHDELMALLPAEAKEGAA